jgi:hypothetical protein
MTISTKKSDPKCRKLLRTLSNTVSFVALLVFYWLKSFSHRFFHLHSADEIIWRHGEIRGPMSLHFCLGIPKNIAVTLKAFPTAFPNRSPKSFKGTVCTKSGVVGRSKIVEECWGLKICMKYAETRWPIGR